MLRWQNKVVQICWVCENKLCVLCEKWKLCIFVEHGMKQCLFVPCAEWNKVYLSSVQNETDRDSAYLLSTQSETVRICQVFSMNKWKFVEQHHTVYSTPVKRTEWNSAFLSSVRNEIGSICRVCGTETAHICWVGIMEQCGWVWEMKQCVFAEWAGWNGAHVGCAAWHNA